MSDYCAPLWRCSNCGCPMLDHAVDDEERRECGSCECRQYVIGKTAEPRNQAMTLPPQRPRRAECGCDIEEHDPGCHLEPIPVPRETLEQVREALQAVRNTDDHADSEVRASTRAALALLDKVLK